MLLHYLVKVKNPKMLPNFYVECDNCRLPENTPASQALHATVNRSPHQHSSLCWLEAAAGSSTEKLAAARGRRRWPICWCCLDRGPGSFDVEDATTLSWSSGAAVSEWVTILNCCTPGAILLDACIVLQTPQHLCPWNFSLSAITCCRLY